MEIQQRDAFQGHISKQIELYSSNLLLSLIDRKGLEQDIGEEYEKNFQLYSHLYAPHLTSQAPNGESRKKLKYIAFDFHKECAGGQYSNIDVLLLYIKPVLLHNSYFLKDSSGTLIEEQQGNIRTNCIDCLDRTNVIQCQIAKFMLFVQLSTLGIIEKSSMSIPPTSYLNYHLNHIWANHADAISTRYTGFLSLPSLSPLSFSFLLPSVSYSSFLLGSESSSFQFPSISSPSPSPCFVFFILPSWLVFRSSSYSLSSSTLFLPVKFLLFTHSPFPFSQILPSFLSPSSVLIPSPSHPFSSLSVPFSPSLSARQ